MPLTKLDATTLVQFCANCGTERELALSECIHEKDEDAGSEILRMPRCQKCDSTELLLPSRFDAAPHPRQGSYGHLHQLLVDELKERLSPAAASAEARDHLDLKKWFPEGLRLSHPTDFERPQEQTNAKKDQSK